MTANASDVLETATLVLTALMMHEAVLGPVHSLHLQRLPSGNYKARIHRAPEPGDVPQEPFEATATTLPLAWIAALRLAQQPAPAADTTLTIITDDPTDA
jgi:hypothetical protein